MADLEILECAFREGYGGWKDHGALFQESIFPALRSAATESTTTEEVCALIGSQLNRVNDNHLGASYYKSPGNCAKPESRAGGVGSNIKPRDSIPWAVFDRSVGGRTVSVLSITHLPGPDNQGWAGFEEKAREIREASAPLILDLRGNGGGNDAMPERMARLLYSAGADEEIPMPASRIHHRKTPEALALFTSNYSLKIPASHLRGETPGQDLWSGYQDYRTELDIALRGAMPIEQVRELPSGPLRESRIFQGPIRILIDSKCGSSCESTVEMFEKHPNAKTVGERTSGHVHYGNLGRLWLRGSNVIVGIPTQRRVFEDGRSVEKVGYAPQIPVAPGGDALEAALSDIQQFL